MWLRRGAYGVHQQLALSACWVTRCQAGVWKDCRVANEAVLQPRPCQQRHAARRPGGGLLPRKGDAHYHCLSNYLKRLCFRKKQKKWLENSQIKKLKEEKKINMRPPRLSRKSSNQHDTTQPRWLVRLVLFQHGAES